MFESGVVIYKCWVSKIFFFCNQAVHRCSVFFPLQRQMGTGWLSEPAFKDNRHSGSHVTGILEVSWDAIHKADTLVFLVPLNHCRHVFLHHLDVIVGVGRLRLEKTPVVRVLIWLGPVRVPRLVLCGTGVVFLFSTNAFLGWWILLCLFGLCQWLQPLHNASIVRRCRCWREESRHWWNLERAGRVWREG